MTIINENNIFDLLDYEFLQDRCVKFETNDIPVSDEKYNNYYNRCFLDLDNDSVQKLVRKVSQFLKSTLELKKIEFLNTWINRVDVESNKKDGFHKDVSDISLLMYLNDDFEGGEFEYINEKNENIKIKPKKNMIIVLRKKTFHRVLPVTKGTRFSLVFFFNYVNKKEKTLI